MSEAIGSRPTSAFRRINCYGSSTRLLRDRFGPLSTTENCDSRKDDNSATCGLRSLRDEDCGSPSAQIDACACTHAALAVDQSQHNCLPHIIYSPRDMQLPRWSGHLKQSDLATLPFSVHSRSVDFATPGEGDWIDLGGTRRTRPGTPIAVAPSGTSSITSVLAAIFAPLPILIGPTNVAPVPT